MVDGVGGVLIRLKFTLRVRVILIWKVEDLEKDGGLKNDYF